MNNFIPLSALVEATKAMNVIVELDPGVAPTSEQWIEVFAAYSTLNYHVKAIGEATKVQVKA